MHRPWDPHSSPFRQSLRSTQLPRPSVDASAAHPAPNPNPNIRTSAQPKRPTRNSLIVLSRNRNNKKLAAYASQITSLRASRNNIVAKNKGRGSLFSLGRRHPHLP